MKSIKVILLALLTFSFITSYGQRDNEREKEGFSLDRVYVGGNLGGGLSQFYSFAEVSPLVGYRFTDMLSAGAGFTFQYFNYKIYDAENFFYGPRVFGRFHPLNWLFIYSEYEHLYLEYYSPQAPNGEKVQSSNFYVGGGVSSDFSNGSGGFVMLLYNLNDNSRNPFQNPMLRFGFTIGL